MADSVQLTDLDVITRYSIAVRSASADRDELIATLRADLSWLERGRGGRIPYPEPEPTGAEEVEAYDEPEATPAPRRTPVRRASTARKAAAKKTTTRRTAG